MYKLYIIGNGFDRFHNLPTGYNDFHQFIMNNHSDIENLFDEYFQFETNQNNLWSNFERDLGTFKWKAFYNERNHLNIQDDDFRPSYAYGLEYELKQETDEIVDRIREAFGDWVNQINLASIDKKIDFESNAIFLTFNYTLLLEEVYKIPHGNIFHIHGDVQNMQDSLIFGHNKELTTIPEIDENGNSNRTIFTDSEDAAKYPFYAFRKPVNEVISDNKRYFENLRNIEEVAIWGHSLNKIDIPYLKEIIRQTKDSIAWKVSFYKKEEKGTYLETLVQLGVKKNKIELFMMKDHSLK